MAQARMCRGSARPRQVPALVFRIMCPVLATPVGLIYWFFDNHHTGLDTAGIGHISFVDGYRVNGQ
jgi:hypothetical protein